MPIAVRSPRGRGDVGAVTIRLDAYSTKAWIRRKAIPNELDQRVAAHALVVVLTLPQEAGMWDKPCHDSRLDPFIARLKQGSISPSESELRPETREELTALLVEAGLIPEEAARMSADAL